MLIRDFDLESLLLQPIVSSISDPAVGGFYKLTESLLVKLAESDIEKFAVYLIDRYLAVHYKWSFHQPKICATLVSGLLQARPWEVVIDVNPSSGELFAQYGYIGLNYLVSSGSGIEEHLARLKLDILGAHYDILSSTYLPSYEDRETQFVVDLTRRTGSKSRKSDPVAQLVSFLSLKKNGCYVVLTPLHAGGVDAVDLKLLELMHKGCAVEAVVRYSVPSIKGWSSGMAIVAAKESILPQKRGVLYIDVTEGNEQLRDLNGLEAASLAGVLYRLYMGGHLNASPSMPNVEKVVNAYFSAGYRDFKNLCSVEPLPQGVQFATDPWKNFTGEGYLQSLLINGEKIDDLLQSSRSNNCIYIIGNNGEGKSFLLRDLIYSSTRQREKCLAISISPVDRFPSPLEFTGDLFQKLGTIALDAQLPLANRGQATTDAVMSMLGDESRVGAFSRAMIDLGFGESFYLVRAETENSSKNNKATIPLNHFLKINPRGVRRSQLKNYEVGLSHPTSKKIFTFSKLSSGERNVIQLLAHIISEASPNVTIFIDEPEISLHVKWQQILPKIFSSIAQDFQLSLVVATHSPVLIANADFPNVKCYVAVKGSLMEVDPSDRHSVETILLQGFHTYTPHNREVHETCAKLVSNIVELVNTDERAAHDMGHRALAELDNFTRIIKATSQAKDDSRERGHLELIDKAVTAIKSVVRME